MATEDNGVGGPRQISVSRDALRADLAEMELRLKSYIAVELEKKAGADAFAKLSSAVSVLQDQMVRRNDPAYESWQNFSEGNVTASQKRVIETIVDDRFERREHVGWTKRERIMGLITLAVAIIALVFTAVYTINAIEHNPNTGLNTPSSGTPAAGSVK